MGDAFIMLGSLYYGDGACGKGLGTTREGPRKRRTVHTMFSCAWVVSPGGDLILVVPDRGGQNILENCARKIRLETERAEFGLGRTPEPGISPAQNMTEHVLSIITQEIHLAFSSCLSTQT
jgi:hypothetical protein